MSLPRNQVLIGDAQEQLARLPAASVDMILTSPPYFRLRNYDVEGELGLEPAVGEWVTALRGVIGQLERVLTPTGTLWLNVADTYATHLQQGAPRKSLLLAPERLVLALLEDGWLLRNKIVWAKTNPMPTPVTDRLACTWEALYVLVKQRAYYFDLHAIRQPHLTSRPPSEAALQLTKAAWRGPNTNGVAGLDALKAQGRVGHPLGKNPGDVWPLATSNYRGAHHATFPVALAERAIRAGCPEQRCTQCRQPWRRPVHRSTAAGSGEVASRGRLRAVCPCGSPAEPGLVLDPFMGAGTTALAAERHGRDWLGIELNAGYAALGESRIRRARPYDAHAPP